MTIVYSYYFIVNTSYFMYFCDDYYDDTNKCDTILTKC